MPNAVGAVANHAVGATSTTTLDANYTVGTISYTTSVNKSWTISSGTVTSGTLTLDGGGSGATISNTNTAVGANNANNALLFLGENLTGGQTVTLNLADNLTVSNTGSNSTAANGAILFGYGSVISGSGKNITFTNNNFNIAGRFNTIFLDRGVNTFTGNVSVVKGSVVFNNASSFGAVTTNVITLGASGSDNASLLALANITVVNNWQTAAGNTGTLVLGSYEDRTLTYSGTGTLNSNLTLLSNSTSATRVVTLSGSVSGTGGITATGTGNTRLTQANTYTGGTTISAGTMLINNATGSGSGTGLVSVSSGGTLGGTGKIVPTGANGITVASGGILAPGAGIGTLTFDLSTTTCVVNMAGGSSFKFDLGAPNVSIGTIAAGSSDLLVLSGASASDMEFNGNNVDFWALAPAKAGIRCSTPTVTTPTLGPAHV